MKRIHPAEFVLKSEENPLLLSEMEFPAQNFVISCQKYGKEILNPYTVPHS